MSEFKPPPVTEKWGIESEEGNVFNGKASEPYKFDLKKLVVDVTSVVVNAASKPVERAGRLIHGLMHLIRNPATKVAIAGFVLAGFAPNSSGCQRPDGWDDEPYVAAGSAMQGSLLSFRVWFADKITGQAVGVQNASAVYLNERTVLTSAHIFTDNSQYNVMWCEVGTGSNYATNRGTVVPSFSYQINPQHVPGVGDSGPDIAIIHLAASLSGQLPLIGSANNGEQATHGGFGRSGTSATGSSNDHNSRAWKGEIQNAPSQYSSAYYSATKFYPYTPLNGLGLSGDSGGPVYNQQGQLIGLSISSAGQMTESGVTIYVKLSPPDVATWIATNSVVRPPRAATLSLGSQQQLTITGDTNQIYGIQASTNLVDWLEIGAVTNVLGSSNFTDVEAPIPTKFYRAFTK